jgi:hypothetical protein
MSTSTLCLWLASCRVVHRRLEVAPVMAFPDQDLTPHGGPPPVRCGQNGADSPSRKHSREPHNRHNYDHIIVRDPPSCGSVENQWFQGVSQQAPTSGAPWEGPSPPLPDPDDMSPAAPTSGAPWGGHPHQTPVRVADAGKCPEGFWGGG